MPSHLELVHKQLRAAAASQRRAKKTYAVPSLWTANGRAGSMLRVEPYDYFARATAAILRKPPVKRKKGPGGSWTKEAVIYNMFVRAAAAFDHNEDGRLNLPVNEGGWRETGSFLKALAMIPYIASLGANTIHLLPVTSIGSDGNKGTLGSPYAIKNPYELDEHLCEPKLGLGVENEFKAFVEAAHRYGIRVVAEFVFRTAAKDGDWIKEHPEWFYWIRDAVHDRAPGEHDETKYGNPIFTPEELHTIKTLVEQRKFTNLPAPHESYRAMFTEPPKDLIIRERGKWIGVFLDGTRARIPGAFADWPPDDSQPPWGDVTYLRMYTHPEFNYIAYNTIRMYDERLTAEYVNRPLWEKIWGIIPHYQRDFGIDGVMIDMGHALPMELKQEMIRRARAIDPEFAFWDENFSVTVQSVREGYNAVFGYQWADQHHPEKFKQLLRVFATGGFPISYFATPENHNTPRAAARPGGLRYSRYAWALSNFIPAVPFLHSGFEVGEELPVNTGLDFSKEMLAHYPSERLPLFSEHAFPWLTKKHLIDWIRRVGKVRRAHQPLITDASPHAFTFIECENPDCIAFVRGKRGSKKRLIVLANANMEKGLKLAVACTTKKRALTDLLGNKKFPVRHGRVTGTLAPGQVVVAEA